MRVVATLGGVVEPDEVSAPGNAHVVAFADHDALVAQADLVVGHGGHGTTMRAIRAGVPMVCIPAKGGDQAPIAALIEEWGVGRALPGDASIAAIAAAADDVLGAASFRNSAEARSSVFAGRDGADPAADALEHLALAQNTGPRWAA